MYFRNVCRLIQLILGLLLFGCQAILPSDYAEILIDDFETANYTVTELGYIASPYFDADVQQLQISGENIQIFEFPNPLSTWLARRQISSDGYTINQQDVQWVSTPHFYSAGHYIILYNGDNYDLISIIENRLGSQFAGGVSYPDI